MYNFVISVLIELESLGRAVITYHPIGRDLVTERPERARYVIPFPSATQPIRIPGATGPTYGRARRSSLDSAASSPSP